MSVVFDTFHFEMSQLNEAVPANMAFIEVTFDTSHLEMSPLNDVAPMKMELMSGTLDTSHSPIDWEKLLLGNTLRYASMALLSSGFDRGENTAANVVAKMGGDEQSVCAIEPNEPSNMTFLLAFELTQEAPQICCLKDVAPMNMLFIAVTLDTSHFEMSRSKDFAPMNMLSIFIAIETSHLEMSPLKDDAS